MSNSLKRVVLLGPQGSGKSTQAKRIADFLNVKVITASQVLKEVVEKGTEMGEKIKEMMSQGVLIPDEHMINLMLGELNAPHCMNGFLLDGFPRNLTQASALHDSCGVDKVFNIEISDDEAINRISGRRSCVNGHVYHLKFKPPIQEGVCDVCQEPLQQRNDDTEEVVIKRLEIYRKETSRLLDYYKKQDKLVLFDGEQPIGKVSEDIIKYLKENVR